MNCVEIERRFKTMLPLVINSKVRTTWDSSLAIARDGHSQRSIAIEGPNASLVAQTLACLDDVHVTLVDASNVTGVHDWWYVETFTPLQGLPLGTPVKGISPGVDVTGLSGRVMLPTVFFKAITDPNPKIIVITGAESVAERDLGRLRGALDEDPGGIGPGSGGRISLDAVIVFAADVFSLAFRSALDNRIGSWIRLE
jgi:hypothetical protein